MSRYSEIEEKRAIFAMMMGGARPDHRWEATESGCGRCPSQSPFRQEPGVHPFVIEEEPS